MDIKLRYYYNEKMSEHLHGAHEANVLDNDHADRRHISRHISATSLIWTTTTPQPKICLADKFTLRNIDILIHW